MHHSGSGGTLTYEHRNLGSSGQKLEATVNAQNLLMPEDSLGFNVAWKQVLLSRASAAQQMCASQTLSAVCTVAVRPMKRPMLINICLQRDETYFSAYCLRTRRSHKLSNFISCSRPNTYAYTAACHGVGLQSVCQRLLATFIPISLDKHAL